MDGAKRCSVQTLSRSRWNCSSWGKACWDEGRDIACYWKTRRKRKQSETRWVCTVTGSPQGQETMSPPTQKHSWGQQKIHHAGQHVVWLKIQEEGGRKSVKVEHIRKWEHTVDVQRWANHHVEYESRTFSPTWISMLVHIGLWVSTEKIRKMVWKSSLKRYSFPWFHRQRLS